MLGGNLWCGVLVGIVQGGLWHMGYVCVCVFTILPPCVGRAECAVCLGGWGFEGRAFEGVPALAEGRVDCACGHCACESLSDGDFDL